MKYNELISKAIETLKDDDRIFTYTIEELDNWNGFADGFRAYRMDEIDELFSGVSIGDFLDKLSSSFDHTDEYFVDTIFGLTSTNDLAEHYRDNVDEGELLDEIIENYDNLDIEWIDEDFDKLVKNIIEYREEVGA